MISHEKYFSQITSPLATLGPDEKIHALTLLNTDVINCKLCDNLASSRTNTVFGRGSPAPLICFIGEAPGADEDRQGLPFVGAAGRLLDKIILAMGLSPDEIYICNILKCRPPENRTPLPNETSNCFPYLEIQLGILRPSYICTLGLTAAQSLLKEPQGTMGSFRSSFREYRGIPVICTYHPAYLLRNPAKKKDVWEDMKLLLDKLGRRAPSQSEPAD